MSFLGKLTQFSELVKGYYTPNQKLACFVLYLKIIAFLENNICIYSKLSKELKNSIKILVGLCQAVLELFDCINILTVLIPNLKKLDLIKFQCYFWVPLFNML